MAKPRGGIMTCFSIEVEEKGEVVKKPFWDTLVDAISDLLGISREEADTLLKATFGILAIMFILKILR